MLKDWKITVINEREVNMSKNTFRILGFILIAWGITICFIPVYSSSRFNMTFNFTGFNIPLGLIIAVIGTFFVWSTYKK